MLYLEKVCFVRYRIDDLDLINNEILWLRLQILQVALLVVSYDFSKIITRLIVYLFFLNKMMRLSCITYHM